MAAFGASAVNATEKRGKAATSATKDLAITQRVIQFVIPASSTVAGPIDIVGATLAPGSLILGGTVNASATLGSTTLAFQTKTATAVIGAAAVVTAERALTVTTALAVPSTATANDTIQCTTAAATSPASDITVTLTLFVGSVGPEVGRVNALPAAGN